MMKNKNKNERVYERFKQRIYKRRPYEQKALDYLYENAKFVEPAEETDSEEDK